MTEPLTAAPGMIVQLPAEDVRTRRERARTWHGLLADDNVEHIADRIRNILTGRRFTWVDSNAYLAAAAWAGPHVRTSCALDPNRPDPVTFHRIGDPTGYDWNDAPRTHDWCGLNVVDTGYVWGISSRHATEAEARDAQSAGEKTWTSVSIEGGIPEDPRGQIRIQQFNGPGEILHWVITPEQPEPGIDELLYELARHDRIARTPGRDLRDHDRRWYDDHPLTDVRLKTFDEAVPALAAWIQGAQW